MTQSLKFLFIIITNDHFNVFTQEDVDSTIDFFFSLVEVNFLCQHMRQYKLVRRIVFIFIIDIVNDKTTDVIVFKNLVPACRQARAGRHDLHGPVHPGLPETAYLKALTLQLD